MRILILCHEFFPEAAGGAQGVGHLAVELAKNHTVDVITKSYQGRPWKTIENRLTVYRVPVWGTTAHGTATAGSMVCYSLFAVISGFILMLKHRYDTVNGQFGIPAGSLAVLLGRLFRVPSLVTLVGAEIFDPPTSDEILALPLAKRLVRWTIRTADYVAGLSHSMIRHVRSDFGIDRPCEVIPFGIPDIAELKVTDSVPSRAPHGQLALLCVARVVARKRHADLLEALLRLPEDLKVTLNVVGNGPEKDHLMAESRKLGLDSRVQFLGLLPDREKWKAYREADIFVLVSTHECLGVVYLEAMQAGLPVIAGDNGGQCDFVQNGVNGVIVGVGDVPGMARAIQNLSRDPALRRRMGQESKRIASDLTVANIAGRYERVFEKMNASQQDEIGIRRR